MTRPDLDALEVLRAKATPGTWGLAPCSGGGLLVTRRPPAAQTHLQVVPDHDAALIVAAVNALPDLLAYVRELERERQNYRAMRDDGGSTHWDIAEAGAICHSECAITQLRDARRAAALAMREKCAQKCESLTCGSANPAHLEGQLCGVRRCVAAIRELEAP